MQSHASPYAKAQMFTTGSGAHLAIMVAVEYSHSTQSDRSPLPGRG